MSAFRATLLREGVELAPTMLLAIGLGIACGMDTAPFHGLSVMDLSYFIPGALFIGLWQGGVDRHRLSDEFQRHRPGSARTVQSARWFVGFLTVMLMFIAMLATRPIAAGLMDAELLARIRAEVEAGRIDRYSRTTLFAAIGASVLLWSTLRITVSWRGVVAPVVLSILLPFAVTIAVAHAVPQPVLLIVPTILLFSVYQGARLSGVRQ